MDASESPGLVFQRLAHAMAVEMDRRLRSYDVTMSQWAVLKQLWRREGRSQAELQELLRLERATINGLVQRMTRGGLIRLAPDPDDRRVQRIFLTERGWALRQVTIAYEEELTARIFQGFSSDERIFFMRLLARALHNLTGQ